MDAKFKCPMRERGREEGGREGGREASGKEEGGSRKVFFLKDTQNDTLIFECCGQLLDEIALPLRRISQSYIFIPVPPDLPLQDAAAVPTETWYSVLDACVLFAKSRVHGLEHCHVDGGCDPTKFQLVEESLHLCLLPAVQVKQACPLLQLQEILKGVGVVRGGVF